MYPKAMTMARLRGIARELIDPRACLEERREPGQPRKYVVLIPGGGDVLQGGTLLDLYAQLSPRRPVMAPP